MSINADVSTQERAARKTTRTDQIRESLRDYRVRSATFDLRGTHKRVVDRGKRDPRMDGHLVSRGEACKVRSAPAVEEEIPATREPLSAAM